MALLSVCVSVPLAAQSPMRPNPSAGFDNDRARANLMLEMERLHRQPVDPGRLAAAKRQREFEACVVEFTKAWNALMVKGAQGVWSPKQAKAVRKAFTRLVQSEGWMEDAK